MGRIFVYLAAAIAGLILGGVSALYAAGMVPGSRGLAVSDVSVNGWHSDWSIGSATASPVTRARVARHGLLALAKEEAVYFTRATDDAGRPLVETCTYRMRGGDQPADWWSITLYDSDSRLPMNDGNALSVDRKQLGDGEGWTALISASAPEGGTAFLSSKNAGRFDLTLRLYVPREVLLNDPEGQLNPPSIERLRCDGEAPA